MGLTIWSNLLVELSTYHKMKINGLILIILSKRISTEIFLVDSTIASVARMCRVCALGAHALFEFPPTACVACAIHPTAHNTNQTANPTRPSEILPNSFSDGLFSLSQP